jgi:hypothetical protein
MPYEFLEQACEETHIHSFYRHENNLQYASSSNGNEELMDSHADGMAWASV